MLKKAIDEHAEYITADLDRSRPVKKGAATRSRLGVQAAVNMHTMGTIFVGKVRDVQRRAADFKGSDWSGGGRHS